MFSLKTRWLLLGIWLSLPFLILFAAGAWWFWERGWSLYFAIGIAVCGGIGWPLLRSLQRQGIGRKLPDMAGVEADPEWTRRGELAFADVEALAEETKFRDLPLDQPEVWWELLKKVLDLVARRFHPESADPVLETPLPHVLKVVELVASDLRVASTTHIPGAHILTLHDFSRLKRWSAWFPRLVNFYRVAQFALNPAAAVFREIGGYLQGKAMQASVEETQQWALEFAIKRAGYYAIELYSGRLDRYDLDPTQTTEASQADLKQVTQRDATISSEPLRIGVVGQAKAGKSSLINALFGSEIAPTDTVPCTAGVVPYLLKREGLPAALIFDTRGYGVSVTDTQADAVEICRLLLGCDIVLWVCTATTAARELDRKLLDELRTITQQRVDRDPPPLVGVITHIDLLSPFREWAPPYDLVHDQRPKAQSIRTAIEVISHDLGLEPGQFVPVCLRPGAEYNVQETLLPALMHALPEAQRSRLARCLEAHRDAQYWTQLWKQSQNAGRLLWGAGGHLASEAQDQVRNWWQSWTRRN